MYIIHFFKNKLHLMETYGIRTKLLWKQSVDSKHLKLINQKQTLQKKKVFLMHILDFVRLSKDTKSPVVIMQTSPTGLSKTHRQFILIDKHWKKYIQLKSS